MTKIQSIIELDDPILVTGANGFIGRRVVDRLLQLGYVNIRCFVRPSADTSILEGLSLSHPNAQVSIIKGNLLFPTDCAEAGRNVRVIYHLAAGVSKSFSECFMNSVLTTRNLLNVARSSPSFIRFLNISSIAVYSGIKERWGALLDETSEVEKNSYLRGEAYTYGKIKQDEMVRTYFLRQGIPYVIVRPGVVYGPGKDNIMGRVGIDSFGFFMHIGGSNQFPLTHVDNCADAIVLCGLKPGIDGETFNIVDDDLPTCAQFLRQYKKNVRSFFSIRFPYTAFYMLCCFIEKYSKWSKGQFPAVFNRMRCAAHWKKRHYSNQKLKKMVGWKPQITTKQALQSYFIYKSTGERK